VLKLVPRAVPSRATRCVDAFRLRGEAESRAFAAFEDAGSAYQDTVGVRPSLLGQFPRVVCLGRKALQINSKVIHLKE
jgi:hypothetical protein